MLSTIKTKSFLSGLYYPALCIGLSWIYGISSQIIIPLPFNFVPLSIHPLPVTLCTMLFGWPAVVAYVLFLMQGVMGAPFFAGFNSGIIYLLGPTGGYLIGFLGSALFLNAVRSIRPTSRMLTFIKLTCSNVITFACGLAYLRYFVPINKLIWVGLVPFLVGDFVIKAIIQLFLIELLSIKTNKNFPNNNAHGR